MSTTKHREVAKLDRVPLPVEAARIGATGWQITRTGARVVTTLAGKGSLQQKIIKQIPKTFADLGPTYVKFGQIIASSPARSASRCRESSAAARRGPTGRRSRSAQAGPRRSRRRAVQLFDVRGATVASALIAQRHDATLYSGEEVVVKIQRTGIRRRVAADLQSQARVQVVELAKWAGLSADVVADFADNLAEELDFRLEAQSMDAWVSRMHASRLAGAPRAAGELGLTSERADDGTGPGRPDRRRRRYPQGVRRRDRAGQGIAVQRFRGRSAERPSTATCTRETFTLTSTARSSSSTSASWSGSIRAPVGPGIGVSLLVRRTSRGGKIVVPMGVVGNVKRRLTPRRTWSSSRSAERCDLGASATPRSASSSRRSPRHTTRLPRGWSSACIVVPLRRVGHEAASSEGQMMSIRS